MIVKSFVLSRFLDVDNSIQIYIFILGIGQNKLNSKTLKAS